jgi:hypothetical protein
VRRRTGAEEVEAVEVEAEADGPKCEAEVDG